MKPVTANTSGSLVTPRRSLQALFFKLRQPPVPSFIAPPHSSTACPPRLTPLSRTANALPTLSSVLHIFSWMVGICLQLFQPKVPVKDVHQTTGYVRVQRLQFPSASPVIECDVTIVAIHFTCFISLIHGIVWSGISETSCECTAEIHYPDLKLLNEGHKSMSNFSASSFVGLSFLLVNLRLRSLRKTSFS